MNRGFVKIWRCIEESGLLANSKLCQVFFWLVIKASSKARKQLIGTQMLLLLPGQVVVGRKMLATKLQLGEQQVRTALKTLEKMGIINQQATNKFTLVSFVHWEKYQHSYQKDNETLLKPNSLMSSSHKQKNIREMAAIFPPVAGIDNQLSTTIKEEYTNREKERNHFSSYATHSCNLDKKYFLRKEEVGKERFSDIEAKRNEDFERIWQLYPVKQGKEEAFFQWLCAKEENSALQLTDILSSLNAMIQFDSRWRRGKIPNLSRWIARKGWLDEPFSEQSMQVKGGQKGNKDTQQHRRMRAERVLHAIKEPVANVANIDT